MNKISTDIKAEQELESVGKIIKKARQEHSIRNLNTISEELCIRPHLLEALEQGNFNSFPSACYATGFLRNYATFLGLDTADIIAKYEAEYAGSKESVVLSFPEADHQNDFPIKSMAGVASLCIAIFAGVWVTNNSLDAEEAADIIVKTSTKSTLVVEEMPEKKIAVQEVSAKAPIAEKENMVIAAPAMGGAISFQANDDVWVRISSEDGETVIEKLMTKGESLIPPEQSGLMLMTNNAGALTVSLGDNIVKSLGLEGQILENVALIQEKLIELSMLR
ncbi:DUF4115 domain-containing protein [Emcibacteraceae bacterium]|nr:DUF4115 domain-containing protein [Emcibacteraceae bacterium]